MKPGPKHDSHRIRMRTELAVVFQWLFSLLRSSLLLHMVVALTPSPSFSSCCQRSFRFRGSLLSPRPLPPSTSSSLGRQRRRRPMICLEYQKEEKEKGGGKGTSDGLPFLFFLFCLLLQSPFQVPLPLLPQEKRGEKEMGKELLTSVCVCSRNCCVAINNLGREHFFRHWKKGKGELSYNRQREGNSTVMLLLGNESGQSTISISERGGEQPDFFPLIGSSEKERVHLRIGDSMRARCRHHFYPDRPTTQIGLLHSGCLPSPFPPPFFPFGALTQPGCHVQFNPETSSRRTKERMQHSRGSLAIPTKVLLLLLSLHPV